MPRIFVIVIIMFHVQQSMKTEALHWQARVVVLLADRVFLKKFGRTTGQVQMV